MEPQIEQMEPRFPPYSIVLKFIKRTDKEQKISEGMYKYIELVFLGLLNYSAINSHFSNVHLPQ